jgi:hypothetical protein
MTLTMATAPMPTGPGRATLVAVLVYCSAPFAGAQQSNVCCNLDGATRAWQAAPGVGNREKVMGAHGAHLNPLGVCVRTAIPSMWIIWRSPTDFPRVLNPWLKIRSASGREPNVPQRVRRQRLRRRKVRATLSPEYPWVVKSLSTDLNPNRLKTS